MQTLLQFIEKFALDVIGTVLPGLIFISGILLILIGGDGFLSLAGATQSSISIAVVTLLASYAAGHLLCSIGEKLIEPLFLALCSKITVLIEKLKKVNCLKPVLNFIQNLFPNETPKYDNLIKRLTGSLDAKAFADIASHVSERYKGEITKENFNSFRYLALAISPESNQLTYKFMFISLMCLGLSTASILLGFLILIIMITESNDSLLWIFSVFTLLGFVPHFFMLRRFDFYRRALSCPFSSAIIARETTKSKMSNE